MRVLLVEDDPMLGNAVSQALQDASFAVDWLQDGRSASAALARQHAFDMILLDLGLPRLDGLGVLRALRAAGDMTPVLVITGRDAVEQRIEGLSTGADDYLVKPFAVGELLSRMRALDCRRAGVGPPVLTNGTISLDSATRMATVAEGEQMLSDREFAVLRELLTRPGAVLSHAELEHRLFGSGEEGERNVVECIVQSLRCKLGAQRIRNVRGMGWMVERVADSGVFGRTPQEAHREEPEPQPKGALSLQPET